MIKKDEPFLIEFNVRMGTRMSGYNPRLKTDLLKIIEYSLKNKLEK